MGNETPCHQRMIKILIISAIIKSKSINSLFSLTYMYRFDTWKNPKHRTLRKCTANIIRILQWYLREYRKFSYFFGNAKWLLWTCGWMSSVKVIPAPPLPHGIGTCPCPERKSHLQGKGKIPLKKWSASLSSSQCWVRQHPPISCFFWVHTSYLSR